MALQSLNEAEAHAPRIPVEQKGLALEFVPEASMRPRRMRLGYKTETVCYLAVSRELQ